MANGGPHDSAYRACRLWTDLPSRVAETVVGHVVQRWSDNLADAAIGDLRDVFLTTFCITPIKLTPPSAMRGQPFCNHQKATNERIQPMPKTPRRDQR